MWSSARVANGRAYSLNTNAEEHHMRTDNLRVLIVGSGAREHALYDAAVRSRRVREVWVTPGNGGIPSEYRLTKASHDVKEIARAATFLDIDLVIAGDDASVAAGLFDACASVGIRVFGPTQKAGQLEGSKIFAKTRCLKWHIPTAAFDWTNEYTVAARMIKENGYRVIKPDGLCKGKGVQVTRSEEEALYFAHEMLVKRMHKEAGMRIVMEDTLEGDEYSVHAFCDGENAVILPFTRDYKRLSADPGAPNTGGMGAYAPVHTVSPPQIAAIKERILLPTLQGMKRSGMPYHGMLYVNLMMTTQGPMVLEFNCRFGDPEAQILLPLFVSDPIEYMLACLMPGGLSRLPEPLFSHDAAVCVVSTSEQYPDTVDVGRRIKTEACHDYEAGRLCFHAGTEKHNGILATNGGRIMSFVGIAPTFREAQEKAYDNLTNVRFEGMNYRTDIADEVCEPEE